jgi:hypothetical protein
MKRPTKRSAVFVTAVASLTAGGSVLAVSAARSDAVFQTEISEAARTQLLQQIDKVQGSWISAASFHTLQKNSTPSHSLTTHDLTTHDQTLSIGTKPKPRLNSNPKKGSLTPTIGTVAIADSVMNAFQACQTAQNASSGSNDAD